MTEINRGIPQEMKFAPHTGDVIARSAQDLMRAGITIPVALVENRWGSEQAEEYRSWQIDRNRRSMPAKGDIFQS